MSENTIQQDQAEYKAFNLCAIGPALTPTVFQARCECGRTLVTLGGLGVTLAPIEPGCDLVARCSCHREYSLAFQMARELAAMQQQAPQPGIEAPGSDPDRPPVQEHRPPSAQPHHRRKR